MNYSKSEQLFQEKAVLSDILNNECVSEFGSFETSAKTNKKLP